MSNQGWGSAPWGNQGNNQGGYQNPPPPERDPWDPPQPPPPQGPPTQWALERVKPAAIALIVAGSIAAMSSMSGAVSRELTIGLLPKLTGTSAASLPLASEVISLSFSLFCVLWNVAIIWGGIELLRLRRYGLVLAASIMVMVPCIGCCFIGFPIGVWVFSVINDEQVRKSFSA